MHAMNRLSKSFAAGALHLLIGQLLSLGFIQTVAAQAPRSEPVHVPAAQPQYKVSHRISKPSALLDGITPEAKWIWDAGETNPLNYYLYARKSFSLDAKPTEAHAFVSASAFAEIYMNGIYIDRVPTNPDPVHQTYERIDLMPYLREGPNTIAALVYNAGCGLHHRMDARGGFFFQGRVTDSEKNTVRINSDKRWNVTRAVAWDTATEYRQQDRTIGFRERYDARLSLDGWETAEFDDSDWKAATEIGVPPTETWKNIVVIDGARALIEKRKPVASWRANGYRVYDFGKTITAYPQFRLTAENAGTEIILGTSERLGENRFPVMKDNVNYTDTYITKAGAQSWFPLTWRGYRYFAIEEKDGVTIDEVSAVFRSFPVSNAGSFACSDPALTKIWEVGPWSLQICAHDTWIDTPWREQTQYISGDTRYNIRYSAYAFAPSIRQLHDYNILSGAFSQRHSGEGAIRARYPTGFKTGPRSSTYIPDYQLEWILMLKEYHMYYDNRELLAQVYPNMQGVLSYFKSHLSEDRGLVGKVRGWVVLDHPDTYPQDVDGENTAINCLYHGALNTAAWIAREIMGEPDQAAQWEQEAATLKGNILKYLWSDEDKAFRDGLDSQRITQQTQVYALLYGLVPEKHIDRVVQFAVSKGRSSEQSFSYWLLHALFRHGQGQFALDYIRKYWGEQMAREDFNGCWHELWEVHRGMSRSHAWTSGPTALLPEFVLGIEPLEPGWKRFKIQPCLHDLEWAKATVPTVAGLIHARVEKTHGADSELAVKMQVEIPTGTSALVYVPMEGGNDGVISANGQIIHAEGKFAGEGGKIGYHAAVEEGFQVFEFPAGHHEIRSETKAD